MGGEARKKVGREENKEKNMHSQIFKIPDPSF